jgi:hypothetical protein
VGVDELVVGRRDVGEDAEPRERIYALVGLEYAVGDGCAGHTVEPVAADDVVAGEGPLLALVGVVDRRALGVGAGHARRGRLEQERRAVCQLQLDQVLDDLGLRVDPDPLAVRELREVDSVATAVPAELDAVVWQAFVRQPRPGAAVAQYVHRGLLEDACPLTLLHVGPVARFEHYAVNARVVQQPCEQQSGRARADDADGSGAVQAVHGVSSSSSTRWATAKAELAAGTPQ